MRVFRFHGTRLARAWVLFCIIASIVIGGSAMAAGLADDMPRLLSVQGHRGASGLAPENTLAAFRKAIDLGADGMEMDLQVTRDGAVVVIHDDTLDRTSDGRGRIADLTLAEVKRADAGSKFGVAFRGERVPTLPEVIDLVKASGNDRVRLNLEIKFARGLEGKPEDIEERVYTILQETGFLNRVSIQSFYHPSPAKMKRLDPRLVTGLLVGRRDAPPDPMGVVKRFLANYYAPESPLVTADMVRTLHQAGIPLVTWTVDEPAEMRRLLDLGVGSLAGDGIISNHPERVLAVLEARR